jgi:hypothetical protein
MFNCVKRVSFSGNIPETVFVTPYSSRAKPRIARSKTWCNIARESWKRYETLPETKNVMERDATIARDKKTL